MKAFLIWIIVVIIQAVLGYPARLLPENYVIEDLLGTNTHYVKYEGKLVVTLPSNAANCKDENATPYRHCTSSEIIECGRYKELSTYFKELRETSTAEIRTTNEGTSRVREQLEDGNYSVEIHSFSERIKFIAFHAQESGVSRWDLSLEVQSRTGRMTSFLAKDFPELKVLSKFKQFFRALHEHTDGYHGNEGTFDFDFDWSNTRQGVHRLQEISVDCQCTVPEKKDEIPCNKLLEGSKSAAPRLTENIAATVWTVASALVFAVLQ